MREVETELATARGAITTLQGEIQALQLQQSGCTCKNDLFKAFSAALVAIMPNETVVQNYGSSDGTDFVQLMNPYLAADSIPSYQISQLSDISIQSETPKQSTPVTAIGTVRLTPVTTHASAKAKRRRIEATTQFITDIELVSESLKDKIRPFFKPNPMATQDLMNDLQRAFIKFKAEQVHKSGENITAAFIQSVIHEGTEERIWSTDFNPRENSGTFTDYLTDRILGESLKECDLQP